MTSWNKTMTSRSSELLAMPPFCMVIVTPFNSLVILMINSFLPLLTLNKQLVRHYLNPDLLHKLQTALPSNLFHQWSSRCQSMAALLLQLLRSKTLGSALSPPSLSLSFDTYKLHKSCIWPLLTSPQLSAWFLGDLQPHLLISPPSEHLAISTGTFQCHSWEDTTGI